MLVPNNPQFSGPTCSHDISYTPDHYCRKIISFNHRNNRPTSERTKCLQNRDNQLFPVLEKMSENVTIAPSPAALDKLKKLFIKNLIFFLVTGNANVFSCHQ